MKLEHGCIDGKWRLRPKVEFQRYMRTSRVQHHANPTEARSFRLRVLMGTMLRVWLEVLIRIQRRTFNPDVLVHGQDQGPKMNIASCLDTVYCVECGITSVIS